MRSTSERTGEVLRRTRALKQRQRARRAALAGVGAAAAGLALVILAALAMPGAPVRPADAGRVGAAGGLFAAGSRAGYVVIGVLAFALGCCVTLLCSRLRRKSRDDRHDRDH